MIVNQSIDVPVMRYEQLDAIRGLAALSVVIHHIILSFPISESDKQYYWYFWKTPLHALFSGGEAVYLFFILSGFVLSLSINSENHSLINFYTKRVFRIYPAYWFVGLFAYICSKSFIDLSPMTGLSDWFNTVWVGVFDTGYFVNQLLLIGVWDNRLLIPVVWTLVHEMRISLVFPIGMPWFMNLTFRSSISVMAGIYILACVSIYLTNNIFHLKSDIPMTLLFLPLFMLGGLLAKYCNSLVEIWRSRSSRDRYLMMAFGLLLYTASSWLLPDSRVSSILALPLSAVGSCIFIIGAIGSTRIRNILSIRPMILLGKISYSLYLIHAVILVAVFRQFWVGEVNSVAIGLVVVSSLFLSWILFRMVEIPSIKMGRHILAIYKK